MLKSLSTCDRHGVKVFDLLSTCARHGSTFCRHALAMGSTSSTCDRQWGQVFDDLAKFSPIWPKSWGGPEKFEKVPETSSRPRRQGRNWRVMTRPRRPDLRVRNGHSGRFWGCRVVTLSRGLKVRDSWRDPKAFPPCPSRSPPQTPQNTPKTPPKGPETAPLGAKNT